MVLELTTKESFVKDTQRGEELDIVVDLQQMNNFKQYVQYPLAINQRIALKNALTNYQTHSFVSCNSFSSSKFHQFGKRYFGFDPFQRIFRQRNLYPENEGQFEDLPERPLDPEDAEFQRNLRQFGPHYPNDPTEGLSAQEKLKYHHYLNRDPNAKWDFPEERRNFGETLPWDYEHLNVDGPDPLPDIPLWRSLVYVGGFVGIAAGLVWLSEWIEEVVMKRIFPGEKYNTPRDDSVPFLERMFVREEDLVVDNYSPQL